MSEKRANATSQYLIAHNINPGRIKTVGYGEKYPKYTNETEAGRAGNRRVEFQLVKEQAAGIQ